MVSALTFMSLIHCDFIFAYGVRKWSSFMLLHIRLFSTDDKRMMASQTDGKR